MSLEEKLVKLPTMLVPGASLVDWVTRYRAGEKPSFYEALEHDAVKAVVYTCATLFLLYKN